MVYAFVLGYGVFVPGLHQVALYAQLLLRQRLQGLPQVFLF
jgi:hypothetical protein